MFCSNVIAFLLTVEELKQFMACAKLQLPMTWQRGGEPPKLEETTHDSVKEDKDGSATITRVDFIPISSGRERYGSGMATWPKFSLDDELILKNFCR